MKYLIQVLIICLLLPSSGLLAQDINGLPKGFAPFERALMQDYLQSRSQAASGITSPPPFAVRTMAEWEEIESIVITWTQYTPTLREIVRHAQTECEVIIICSDSVSVKTNLQNNNIPDINLSFIEAPFNSIWMRDYGGNSVYKEDVDSLILVDWIYNRPRPLDDLAPEEVANFANVPIYSTTEAPYGLVHTGGNFMSDGLGTGFSSKLVLDENGAQGGFNPATLTEADVDQIMNEFMGINRYIKMEVLPFDLIHHIDMHMKLLDEETLLVGRYPFGTADGPQIEANLQYVLSNFMAPSGAPYRVIRVDMPPEDGRYPDYEPWWQAGAYRTYSNSVFINKTVLVPIYEEQFDTTALRIMEESLPGYNVVGIDCNSIIQASGALHCITKAVGKKEPLWISHLRLRDTYETVNPYLVDAKVKHISGISGVELYYKTTEAGAYQVLPMTLTNAAEDIYSTEIPAQITGTIIDYYIHAASVSGKEQVRPIVAPEGYFRFKILGEVVGLENFDTNEEGMLSAYPNPAGAITCIPLNLSSPTKGSLKLYDVFGREVIELYTGEFEAGEQNYFFNAMFLAKGSYFLKLETETFIQTQKILLK